MVGSRTFALREESLATMAGLDRECHHLVERRSCSGSTSADPLSFLLGSAAVASSVGQGRGL